MLLLGGGGAARSFTPSFATQQTFAAGSHPLSVTVADVNGDGKPDLIVANASDNTVSVLLNTTAPGAATPSFATQQTFAVGNGPISVTVADVNGDGKPDLIVANECDDTVSVLLNTTAPGATTPSFATQQTFAAGSGPYSVTAADINGDGKPDLIVANAWRQHGLGAAQHHRPGRHHAQLRHPADLRRGRRAGLGDGGRRQRRRQARPDRRELRRQHGLGAAQHHRPGRRHAQLRRPADLRHRQRARSR